MHFLLPKHKRMTEATKITLKKVLSILLMKWLLKQVMKLFVFLWPIVHSIQLRATSRQINEAASLAREEFEVLTPECLYGRKLRTRLMDWLGHTLFVSW